MWDGKSTLSNKLLRHLRFALPKIKTRPPPQETNVEDGFVDIDLF